MQIQGFNFSHFSSEEIQKMIDTHGFMFLIDVVWVIIVAIFSIFFVWYALPFLKIWIENKKMHSLKKSKKSSLQKILIQKEIEEEIEKEIQEDTQKELERKMKALE